MAIAPGVQPTPVVPAPQEELIIPPGGAVAQPNVRQLTAAEYAALPAATQIALRRFGRFTRAVSTDVVLAAATVAQLVPNNPDRVGFIVSNTGLSNPFTVLSDQSKTAAQGDVIGPNGGTYSLSVVEDAETTGREVDAISTSGTTVHLEETIAYGPLILLPPGVVAI